MAEDESTEAAGRSTDDVGKAAALPKTNFLGRIHNGAGAAVLIVSLGDDDDDPPPLPPPQILPSVDGPSERAIVHPDNDVFWVGREGGA